MSLIAAINANGRTLLVADCLVTVRSGRNEICEVSSYKFGNICSGIVYVIAGSPKYAKIFLEKVRTNFLIEKTYEKRISFLKHLCETDNFRPEGLSEGFVIYLAVQDSSGSNLFRIESGYPLDELNNAGLAAGSGSEVINQKLTDLLRELISKEVTIEDSGPIIVSYLNQWCFGMKTTEGLDYKFGGRMIYLFQDSNREYRQPPTINLIGLQGNDCIEIIPYFHFWWKGALVLYDGNESNYSVLADSFDYNCEIKSGEAKQLLGELGKKVDGEIVMEKFTCLTVENDPLNLSGNCIPDLKITKGKFGDLTQELLYSVNQMAKKFRTTKIVFKNGAR